jgi:hypothetical protein
MINGWVKQPLMENWNRAIHRSFRKLVVIVLAIIGFMYLVKFNKR